MAAVEACPRITSIALGSSKTLDPETLQCLKKQNIQHLSLFRGWYGEDDDLAAVIDTLGSSLIPAWFQPESRVHFLLLTHLHLP